MTKRALCVGINRFTDRELPPLKGAVNDARTLSLMLMRDFGFDPRNVRVLADEQATRAALLSSIGALLEGTRPGDELVLFASTHGSHVPDQDGDDEDGYDEVLVAHDHDWERAVLSDDELARALAALPQGVRLTAIWDTCHAGTLQDTASAAYRTRALSRDEGLAKGVELLGPRYVPLPERYDVTRGTKAVRKRPAKGSTRKKKPAAGAEHGAMGALVHDGFPAVSLSGCSDDETSADASFGGIYEGAFSHAMLDVLRRTKEDLTWEELHARTRSLMTRLGIKQTPQIHVPKGGAGAPVFGGRARRSATAPAATELASVEREIVEHEQSGRWSEAVAACWRRVALVPGAAEKVRTIEHVVSIHRAVLRDEAAAMRATEEVLRIDPAHAGALAYLRASGVRR
jgi:hypothetical protein